MQAINVSNFRRFRHRGIVMEETPRDNSFERNRAKLEFAIRAYALIHWRRKALNITDSAAFLSHRCATQISSRKVKVRLMRAIIRYNYFEITQRKKYAMNVRIAIRKGRHNSAATLILKQPRTTHFSYGFISP